MAPTLRPATYSATKHYLGSSFEPLHSVSVHTLSRRQITARVTDIAQSAGPVAAARPRSALSAMFNWAIGEGIEIVANPVFGSNRPAQPASRERVLTSEELKAVWRACADDDHGRIIRLLMLTAQRRGEVGGMRRSELNLSGTWEVGGALQGTGMWTLPAQRTKNAREHAVPLIGAALALLPPRRAGTDLVFGSGRNGFVNWGKAKAELDDRVGEGVASWVVHDLRRSVATGLADLGVLPHIIEAVLNHVSGHKSGVAGVYNRARYAPEVRDALAKWSEHLSAIVA